jgi:hypothetical protein
MELKRGVKPFFSVCLCLILSSCAMSKEDCLYNYERFIDEVRANHAGYTEKDWRKADKRFNRFNGILTKRYKDKLTLEEKIRVSMARVIYDSCRYGGGLLDKINKITGGIKDGLKDYTDNHLAEDIEFLREQGVKIGDSIKDSIDRLERGDN